LVNVLTVLDVTLDQATHILSKPLSSLHVSRHVVCRIGVCIYLLHAFSSVRSIAIDESLRHSEPVQVFVFFQI